MRAANSECRPADGPDELYEGVIIELASVATFVRRTWIRQIAEAAPDLGISDVVVMHLLRRQQCATVTEISCRLELDKADISRRIANLRKLGYVVGEPSPEDRRVQLLSLTARGQEVIDTVRQSTASAYKERLSDWSPEQLREFTVMLTKFNEDAHAEQGA